MNRMGKERKKEAGGNTTAGHIDLFKDMDVGHLANIDFIFKELIVSLCLMFTHLFVCLFIHSSIQTEGK